MGSGSKADPSRRAEDHPLPVCPVCHHYMDEWPALTPVQICGTCKRPVMLFPASLSERRYWLTPLLDNIHIAGMPIIGGALVAWFMMLGTNLAVMQVIVGAVIVHGVIMVWDGTAAIESHMDKGWKTLIVGTNAKWRGVRRTLWGLAALGVGLFQLFFILPVIRF